MSIRHAHAAYWVPKYLPFSLLHYLGYRLTLSQSKPGQSPIRWHVCVHRATGRQAPWGESLQEQEDSIIRYVIQREFRCLIGEPTPSSPWSASGLPHKIG
jgi:hypothetical protein